MELKVQRLQPHAKLPGYGHPGDAGLDLFSSIDMILQPGDSQPVPTGIKVAIPDGYVGLIWDKSGISLSRVHRLAGVVDSGYRGEIKVVLINLGTQEFAIAQGMKIAQMLIQPVQAVIVTESQDLEESERGENGFGSTGRF